MSRSKPDVEQRNAPKGHVPVPAGAAPWVTSQLLLATIETWQPYYEKPLTPEDALEILLNVNQLLAVLEDPGDAQDKKVRRPGTRLQP